MSVAGIFNTPETPQTLASWSFDHAGHHRDVNRRIFEVFAIVIPDFPLDPFNPADTGVWGRQHQILHSEINSVLGLQGNDLIEVNWKDENERVSWIDLNAREHLSWNEIVGV